MAKITLTNKENGFTKVIEVSYNTANDVYHCLDKYYWQKDTKLKGLEIRDIDDNITFVSTNGITEFTIDGSFVTIKYSLEIKNK
jgi:hypothetical protein